MPTTLHTLADTDQISDRACLILTRWRDAIRAADPDDLRPRRDPEPEGLAGIRLPLREKARLLAAICLADGPLETVPHRMASLVGHPQIDSTVWWQILAGSDCNFVGTTDVVNNTFPHLNRSELPIRRLRLVARTLLSGDRRSDVDIAADPDCGDVCYKVVARVRRTIDTSAADLQRHAAAAYRWVQQERAGTVKDFARERGIRYQLALELMADARGADLAVA